MDRLFTNKMDTTQEVHALKKEIHALHGQIAHLKKQLTKVQENCHHRFEETDLLRTCQKCHYTESLYY